MANQAVCAVFDSAVKAYMRPIFAQSSGSAIRAFEDEVKRAPSEHADSPMYRHPEDYTLFQLAWWNDETGEFNHPETTILLCRGKDVAVNDGRNVG